MLAILKGHLRWEGPVHQRSFSRWPRVLRHVSQAVLMLRLLSGVLLIGSTSDVAASSQARPDCSSAGITVDGNFDQAGFAACTIGEDGVVILQIRPETEPINPSPWYAARLTQTVSVNRRVLLSYYGVRHRYQPWFSTDGRTWQRLTVEVGDASSDRVSFVLPAFVGSSYVSAQPLAPLAAVSDRWSQLVADGIVTTMTGGTSVEGRAVPLFRAGPVDATRLHLVATRQHPPETGGAAAFDAFATHLLELASRRSCPSDAILFAPIVNPDGIARGHWRTNFGLADLNRDWGRFSQPETRAVGTTVADLASSATLVSVIDFHSTRDGSIYVSRMADANASAFAAAVAQRTGLAVIETRSAGGDTLKSWSEDTFGSASFTVELPDSASPQEAALAGTAIAEQFALRYLCSDSGAS